MSRIWSQLVITLSFLAIIFVPNSSSAISVLRTNISINGSNHSVDIALFNDLVPTTVNNFLSYVDDNSYQNLLIYRNSPGFVIQTGGYTYDPTLNGGGFLFDFSIPEFNGGLQPVNDKGQIANEFKLGNRRGTLAMAKLPNLPDSASSEWFVNLIDNISTLDTQNDGFTVFGEVLGNGMDVFDSIAATPIYNFTPPFSELPLINYAGSLDPVNIQPENLITFDNFEKIIDITTIVDFGDAVANTSVQRNIDITNTGTSSIQLGTIDTSSIEAPFSILNNPCEGMLLLPAETCVIQAQLIPPSNDYFYGEFLIEILSERHTFKVELKTPSPDIDPTENNIEFGAQPVYDPLQGFPVQKAVVIYNRGERELNISSISIDGPNSSEFELIDNCTTANNPFLPGIVPPYEFCAIAVNFLPIDLNEKFASLNIISDDPNTGTLLIDIKGGSSTDNDNIPAYIENNAPNSGDANNDGLPDAIQDNVVSFLTLDNTYMTLVTNTGLLLNNINAIDISSLATAPDNAGFYKDAFSFELSGIAAGTTVDIGIILPSGVGPENIFVYGPTSTDTNPHWYALDNNSDPGVFIFGNVTLGVEISRNISLMKLVDGGIGDTDMTANGVISFTGAIDFPSDPDLQDQDNGGSISLLTMILFILSGSFARLYRRMNPAL